jgi:hypothetical protein
LDEDGYLGITIFGFNCGDVAIFLNHGNIWQRIFSNIAELCAGRKDTQPFWVSVGDFNESNHLDLAVRNYATEGVDSF